MWVILWQTNYHELYNGNNPCFSGNTVATYGGDDALYCANPWTISGLNATVFSTGVTLYSFNQTASDIQVVDSQYFNYTTNIYIDDDDEEIGWWFNINPGSKVQMYFSNIYSNGSDIYMQIDDEDAGYTIPNGSDGAYLYAPEVENNIYSRGCKISFKTDGEFRGYAGNVEFNYLETYFSVENATSICRFSPFCLYDIPFPSDFCLLVRNVNYRDWSNDYAPSCVRILQTGHDKTIAGIIIPVFSEIIALIIIINIVVMCVLAKQRNKLSEFTEEESLTKMDYNDDDDFTTSK